MVCLFYLVDLQNVEKLNWQELLRPFKIRVHVPDAHLKTHPNSDVPPSAPPTKTWDQCN